MRQPRSSESSTKTLAVMPSEKPSGGGQPCLVVIKGDNLGTRVDLAGEVEIGRSEDCAITVNSGLVSRKHAAIQRIGGQWVVCDIQSTNGTYVNGQRIKVHALKDGDKISVGRTVLKYLESNLELQYHAQIMDMASRDALTGAYNKRHFDVVLKREVADSAQHDMPLCLVVFDIDHFKQVNDTFGHPAGDAVLKQVKVTVEAALADGELFARVGGEEFAVVLPGCDVDVALQKAEAIRKAIEAERFLWAQKRIPVTVSLGVAQRLKSDGPTELYQKADKRLYHAKHSGRNQVA
jgi:diguanylate cyclase (GGDEF)-like protein